MPDKLKELQDVFYAEAKKYDVLPLDNSTLARFLTQRPSATAGRTVFTYSGRTGRRAGQRRPEHLERSYTITAEVEIPRGRRGRHDRHRGRALRRLRPVPEQR
jgi:arylsulfatase